MGYSEVCCQLCGTSFNIGRVRKTGEPFSAAFSFAEGGFFPEVNFAKKETSRYQQCPPEAGCLNVKAIRRCNLEDGRIRIKADVPDTWLTRNGDDEDTEWTYQSEEDDEAFEWDEDCEDIDCVDAVEKNIISPGEHGSNGSNGLVLQIEKVRESLNEISNESSNHDEDEEMPEEESDGSDSDDKFIERYHKCNLLEHVAGPGCVHPRGYNGHNISAEEMMGSGTVQCLVRKFPGWEHDTTDESWEVTSDYFLSGLGGHMHSRDYGGLKCIPIRHGIEEEIYPDDSYWDNSQSNEWECPMPFHPSCLEVFKRVSHQYFGMFNINGLGRWRWAECHSSGNTIDRRLDPTLRRGLEQEWHHVNGDEWLAANPVIVPSLSKILRSAIIEEGDSFSEQISAFSAFHATTLGNTSGSLQDSFTNLPRELLDLIITHLESADIATLRLSSRAFTHLPIFLWKQLLLKEMPWLWEIWDTNETSKWALISSSQLHEEDKLLKRIADELRDRQQRHKHIIMQEMPENYDLYCAENPWVLGDVDAAISSVFTQRITEMARPNLVCRLPRNRTNWFVVYTQITRHWKDLKGLRNRERIWNSCEDMVQRIQRCIDEGKIVA